MSSTLISERKCLDEPKRIAAPKDSKPIPFDGRLGHRANKGKFTRAAATSRAVRPMRHFRIMGHQIRTPALFLCIVETLIAFSVTRIISRVMLPDLGEPALVWEPLSITAVAIIATIAMGLYSTTARDGTVGAILRSFIALFVLAPAGLLLIEGLLPGIWFNVPIYVICAAILFVFMVFVRTIADRGLGGALFRTRVLVLGTGHEASRIVQRMRRRSDRRGLELVGFVSSGEQDLVGNASNAPRFKLDDRPLFDLCVARAADEIVIAQDDRRGGAASRLPLQDLLDCKMLGIGTIELSTFFERESHRIDLDVLRPSWLLFSRGFAQPVHRGIKRAFDLIASLSLLLVTWPIMLLMALAIKLEDGISAPVSYRQERVGLHGTIYTVIKFRSMRTDAERFGQAVWAKENDPRVTRVGRFIRKVRIDELPQLLNILRGEMAFVGPRPERPMFVERFSREIPFYDGRHRVKPGLTGWAQLNYPYGATDEDARRKLEYDLYYVKNYSLLLDLLIFVRTVEVVLIGHGAR